MSLVLLDLNDDCLCELIERVPIADQVRLAQTCFRFQDLIVHKWEIRWRHGALDLNYVNLGYLDMPYFFSVVGNLVRSITARRRFFDTDEEQPDVRLNEMHFWLIIKDCPNLRELTLRHMIGLDAGRLVHYLPRLEALDVKGCDLKRDDISAIISHVRLKRLNLTGVCRNITPRSIFLLAGDVFSAQMQEIKLSLVDFCTSLQDVLRFRRLKILTVSHTEPEMRLENFVMSKVINIFGNRLVQFELRYGLFLTTDHFMRKIRLMKALTVLKFQFVTVEGLDTVAEALTLLRELSFTDCPGVTDADLLNFVRSCRQLAVLDVKGCKNLTEALLWESGEILLNRNAGIRLRIIVSESSLSTDIVQNPSFDRLRSVLEITDNYKHSMRDPQACSNTLTFKFSECSDVQYEMLVKRIYGAKKRQSVS